MRVRHDQLVGGPDELHGATTIQRTPMTVSLFSGPGGSGYARIESVNAGGKLRLPAPFDVTLDTASLPSPRRGDPPSE